MARTVSKSAGKASTGKASTDKPAKSKASTPKKVGRSAGRRLPAGVMIARQAVSALVDQIAADMRAGETTHTIPDLALRLISLPHSVEFLFELLVAEGRATPRDEDRSTTLLLIIGTALGQIRMAIDSQVAGAADTAIGLLGNLLAAAQDGELPSDLILGLAQQFTLVGLPIPDEVRDLIAAAVGEPMEGLPKPSREDVAADFVQMAEALDHDPFQIHEQMSEQFALFPDEARIVAVGLMVDSEAPAMREAALGWLLDPNPEVGRAVAEIVAAAAERGLVSAESVDRLVRMQPWLPNPIRESAGSIVAACRARGIAPRPVEASAPARSVRFVATGIDGSGAQSVFAIVDEAGRHSLLALLMKHGHGLRGTVIQDDVDPAECALLLESMAQGMDCFDASPGFVQDLIAHGLATGLAGGEPPPFELLRFLDAVGLPPIAPARLEAGAIVAQLLDGLPEERRSEAATKAALAASATWAKAYHFPASWFETDMVTIVAATLTAGRKKQGAVLTRIVGPRRSHWGEQLAWIAKAVKGGAERFGADGGTMVGRGRRKLPAAEAWIDLALVARAFLDETPIEDIPLAAEIARQTLSAQRHW